MSCDTVIHDSSQVTQIRVAKNDAHSYYMEFYNKNTRVHRFICVCYSYSLL